MSDVNPARLLHSLCSFFTVEVPLFYEGAFTSSFHCPNSFECFFHHVYSSRPSYAPFSILFLPFFSVFLSEFLPANESSTVLGSDFLVCPSDHLLSFGAIVWTLLSRHNSRAPPQSLSPSRVFLIPLSVACVSTSSLHRQLKRIHFQIRTYTPHATLPPPTRPQNKLSVTSDFSFLKVFFGEIFSSPDLLLRSGFHFCSAGRFCRDAFDPKLFVMAIVSPFDFPSFFQMMYPLDHIGCFPPQPSESIMQGIFGSSFLLDFNFFSYSTTFGFSRSFLNKIEFYLPFSRPFLFFSFDKL